MSGTQAHTDSLLARVEAIEARQRQSGQHDPGCPADHNCLRDHPEAAIYHVPQPCTCWLSRTD